MTIWQKKVLLIGGFLQYPYALFGYSMLESPTFLLENFNPKVIEIDVFESELDPVDFLRALLVLEEE